MRDRIALAPEERVVVACLSFQSDIDLAVLLSHQRQDWSKVLTLAAQQGVAPFISDRISDWKTLAVPTTVWLPLRRAATETAMWNRLIVNVVRSLLDAFQHAGIPILLLKGAALIHTVYRETPHLRDCLDVDVLVRRGDLSRAHQTLLELGYTSEARVPQMGDDAYQLPPYVNKTHPIGVELHVELVKPHTPFRVAVEELWDRARILSIGGREMQIPSPEDMILHLALHVSFHKEFTKNTLRQLHDIGAVAIQERVRWADLCEWARRSHAERPVYYALRLTKDLLAASIPGEVLATLSQAIGGWEMELFEQLEFDGGFLAYRNPLRLLLQMILLQTMAYHGLERRRFIGAMLRHPIAYNRAAAKKLLPQKHYGTRFRPGHILLLLQLCGKGIRIGLSLMQRAGWHSLAIPTWRDHGPFASRKGSSGGSSGPDRLA